MILSGDGMVLQEVLQLEKTQGSIKKIDLFLVSQVKLSDEYVCALSYKAIILHTIGKTNEALKLLFNMVPSFKEMDVNGIIAVCDGIIEICLELKRYDQVLKYIKIKENYLPVSKAVLHIKDNIKYYLAVKRYDDAKEALLKYLSDDITREESIYAKEELSKIYYLEHQYDKYLELAEDLENYYQANLALAPLAELGLNKLKIAFEQRNYLKVIREGLVYIQDDYIDSAQKLVCATLLMRSYLFSNDYKRASIIESEYCELIHAGDKENSLGFCYAALELYTKTNTLVSITEYQNKIRELEAQKKEAKPQKKKNKQEEIVIPVVELPEEPEEEAEPKILSSKPMEEPLQIHQSVQSRVEVIQSAVVSKNYENLESVFQAISELDLKTKFREIFRVCCIRLCEVFPIEEVYLLYYRRQYLGIHYKKERAYDKKLSFEAIENTLSFAAMNYDEEVFLDKDNDRYRQDIVKGCDYEEIPFGYAVPLRDNLKTVGSIAYFAPEAFLDKDMVYESLKLVSSMLNTRLLMSLWQDEVEFNHRKLFFIHENMSSGVKEEIDGYLHFSQTACKMLGVFEDMTEEDYLSKMKTEDIAEYRRIHEELYTLLSENVSLEYDFKRDTDWIRIKERYYPMVLDGVICILSLIDDITLIEQNKKELIHLAYKNPISKLDTEVKLMVDLNRFYPNKKLSLAVVDIIDFNLYRELYGYNFTNQLIYTVGQELMRAYENDFNILIYHLETDRYAILFSDINDKRAVDSKLTQGFKAVSESLWKLNSRVKLLFNAGVYRLARHTNLDDVSKILYFALDALGDAKALDTSSNHIAHFDSDLHKKKFNENHLITHISESIDHGKLGLTYKQIVDLEKNEVYAYSIVLNLDNFEVDSSYMDFVVKRRGLTIQLEKYAISNVFKELKMFKDSLKGYILCFIPVSDATLEENFYSFLETQQSFFKVPKEYIVFQTGHASQGIWQKLRAEGYRIASSNLMDVYSNACDYLMYDYHLASADSIEEIQELCQRHDCTCIFHTINTKEDMEIARTKQLRLIYGEYYKKAIRIKTLIDKMVNQV